MISPPATVYPPTQADQGAQVYYYVCSTCHGDRGQGLAEYRKEIGPPANNCFSSKCHEPNHVEGSFTFPQNVPAVVGPQVLPRFQTAFGLYTFIKTKMPYQAPGSLNADQYWQLTAFLMRANGFDPGPAPLDAARAARITFEGPATTTKTASSFPAWAYAVIAGGLLLIGGICRNVFTHPRKNLP